MSAGSESKPLISLLDIVFFLEYSEILMDESAYIFFILH